MKIPLEKLYLCERLLPEVQVVLQFCRFVFSRLLCDEQHWMLVLMIRDSIISEKLMFTETQCDGVAGGCLKKKKKTELLKDTMFLWSEHAVILFSKLEAA